MERPYVLGSVEDHVPIRHWLWKRQGKALEDLKKHGVTHLIIRKQRFARRLWPFVSEQDFRTFFEEPQDLLEELLLKEAVLIYDKRQIRIYRLR